MRRSRRFGFSSAGSLWLRAEGSPCSSSAPLLKKVVTAKRRSRTMSFCPTTCA